MLELGDARGKKREGNPDWSDIIFRCIFLVSRIAVQENAEPISVIVEVADPG
jgi:hypothetical protein